MKKNLFLSGLYAFLLLAGMLFLLCVFNSCAPEDDLPAEGITSDEVLLDDHVEWVSGTRYFPLRLVFVNSIESEWVSKPNEVIPTEDGGFILKPGTPGIDGYMDYLNEIFAVIDVQFYVACTATMYVHEPKKFPDYFHAHMDDVRDYRFNNVYFVDCDVFTLSDGRMAGGVAYMEMFVALHKASHEITIVHEFGHYFGLHHVSDSDNFMSYTGSTPTFTQGQLDAMLAFIEASSFLPFKGGMP